MFSSRVKVRIRVRNRFSVWLVSGMHMYLYYFLLSLCVYIVPHKTQRITLYYIMHSFGKVIKTTESSINTCA